MKKLLFIIAVWILLFATSCRSVKKQWVKENFTEKVELQEAKETQSQTLKNEVEKIENKITNLKKSLSETQTTKETSEENENTTIEGTLTAEDGKEKSVQIGNTTIKSNGANVTFKTNSSKSTSKEFTSQIERLESQIISIESNYRNLQSDVNTLTKENTDLKRQIEQVKTTKQKDVNKSGFSFGFYLWLVIILALVAVVWYFRVTIGSKLKAFVKWF